GIGVGCDLSFFPRIEIDSRRDCYWRGATCASLGTLWNPGDAQLYSGVERHWQGLSLARTTSLSDAFSALLLVDAAALAGYCLGFLRGLRSRGACDRSPLLAKSRAAQVALLRPAARDRARCSTSNGLRSGDPCPGISVTQRLGITTH